MEPVVLFFLPTVVEKETKLTCRKIGEKRVGAAGIVEKSWETTVGARVQAFCGRECANTGRGATGASRWRQEQVGVNLVGRGTHVVEHHVGRLRRPM